MPIPVLLVSVLVGTALVVVVMDTRRYTRWHVFRRPMRVVVAAMVAMVVASMVMAAVAASAMTVIVAEDSHKEQIHHDSHRGHEEHDLAINSFLLTSGTGGPVWKVVCVVSIEESIAVRTGVMRRFTASITRMPVINHTTKMLATAPRTSARW